MQQINSMILCMLACLLPSMVLAQGTVKINNGTQVNMTSGTQMVIQDMHWDNDGTFNASTSTVRFTGATNDSITGDATTVFYSLEMAKTSGGRLIQGQATGITDSLYFQGGYYDLNGQDLTLDPATGGLSGENPNSRVIGSNGGEIVKIVTLNAPTDENPGNLGATITSPANMGTTIIRRGHRPQNLPYGTSIERYYDILPTNNTGLNATVQFDYYDEELNGLSETDLQLFSGNNGGGNLTPAGFASRDQVANFLQQVGLDGFGRWTASNLSSFPVEWLGFDAWPVESQVQCQWLTATEINSDYFVVERSADGESFAGFATVPAAGNSQEVLTYEAWDPTPFMGRSYYRVKQVDLDGSFSYTSMVEVFFTPTGSLSLFPNPANTQAWLDYEAFEAGPMTLQVIDARGRAIMQMEHQLPAGPHRLPLDVSQLAEGVYTLVVKNRREVLSLRMMIE